MARQSSPNIVQTVKDYSKRLFNFIRGRVATDEDAEDILQEVWYQYTNTVDTEVIEQVSGWLHRVARNKITDKYRKHQNELIDDFAFEDEDGTISFRDILLTDSNNPETEHLRQLFWEQLFAALDELPQSQRDVFIWNELEDRTFAEIATETGENIKTLISRKGYAVKHLRRRLENLYHELMNY
ncbi:MAG: RNA polymerase subunit sigma-24 [Bacteroidetes bacterium 13_1_20CM_4_60_6]|nr:MAG: RNA polymerase subunit sigma-24 [Bacteroidetes bacterium 13_1_20CM_4_60_6]